MGGFDHRQPPGPTRRPTSSRAPGMPSALADAYQLGNVNIRNGAFSAGERRALKTARRWAAKNPYDAGALALSPVPVVGDIAGIANDVRTFSRDPESRTPLNYGLSAFGALPFVPSAAGVLVDHFPKPSWAKGATDVPIYRNPNQKEVGEIIRDPHSGGALALVEDGNGNWYAWRRDNADVHLLMSHDLEERLGATFPRGKQLNRYTAKSAEDAMQIMRDRGRYAR